MRPATGRTDSRGSWPRVLTELFTKDLVALVVDDQKHLLGILTKMDLVDHLTGAVAGRRESAERL